MQIVTTREFRANQKKYFEMAETETILISRRNAAPIMVCAVREGDFPSKEELAAIQRGIDDVSQHTDNHKPFILTFGRKVQAVSEGEQ